MENITGFIVEITTKGNDPISYFYGNSERKLYPGDKFLGYFFQMTDEDENGFWQKSHITKISLVDDKKFLFKYEMDAIFNTELVNFQIIAKRGPESNNIGMPDIYDKFPTWNPL